MKNTLIPLDMVFILQNGTIAKIVDNVPPLTLTPRSSGFLPTSFLHILSVTLALGVPCIAVLELNGGTCHELGIKEGDTIVSESLSKVTKHPTK